MYNAVHINFKGYLHLAFAPRKGWKSGQFELTQADVVFSHLPLSLEHVEIHFNLVVLGIGEDLPRRGGNGGVSFDNAGKQPSLCFNTKGKGRHVHQDHVVNFSGENPGLNRRPNTHHFIGVYAGKGFPVKGLFHQTPHGGHSGGTAHQHDPIDLLGGQTRILQRLNGGSKESVAQISGDGLKNISIHGDLFIFTKVMGHFQKAEGDIDGRLERKVPFGLFRSLLQPFEGQRVDTDILSVAIHNSIQKMLDQPFIPVIPSKPGVAVDGFHVKDAIP